MVYVAKAPTKGTFVLADREFPRKSWYKDTALRKTYVLLMLVVLTSATNGYDGSMVNGLQSLKPWVDYFHPSSSQLGLLNAIMPIGSLVAIPFVPYAADLAGRRMGIFIGCVIIFANKSRLIGVTLQAISINLQMFIAARFLIGFGVAIAHGASPLLITELAHPQDRAVFTTIYNTTWYFGSIIAAWLTRGTESVPNNWSWRIPSLVQALPSIIQVCAVWFVPESPRWHIDKGRPDEALKTLATVHANGNYDDEVVVLEYEEIKETIRMEQESKQTNWSELWRTKGNRHRLVILATAGIFSQWSGNGLVSYYMAPVLKSIGITDSKTQLNINGILQIFNFIVAVTMCFFVDKLGRRKLFLVSTAGMLGTFIVWTICAQQQEVKKSKAAGNAVVAMIFIFYMFYNIAWSGLLVGYTVEILPYSIRAKGMTVVWLCVDIALFFNSYVNPIALEAIHWKYYIVFCVWLTIELFVVWWFYIETRNTPLEEITKHFDGEDAVVGGAAASGRALEAGYGGDANELKRVNTNGVKKSVDISVHRVNKVDEKDDGDIKDAKDFKA
ncbi:hexose transporter protein [Microthyrium microscopicum]|uniref:Hexose transporter protein n=1 Tax=Microthyrium microscopicum TaxID=703497 RepID=A0A6A6UCJ6_9PEZI|nr:hexose transporter protein [Microthyrium microscopicum]